MKDAFISIVVIPIDGPPYVRSIRNELKPMQKVVGGYIDRVMYPIDGVNYDIILNDEGLMVDNPVMNPIFCQLPGDVFVTKPNLDTGEWESLNLEDELRVMAHLKGLDHKQEKA